MKLSTLNSQLKTALLCLAIAICARFAIDTQLQAQTDRNQHLLIEPANVGPAGISVDAGTARFHMLDDQGVFQPPWLIVQREPPMKRERCALVERTSRRRGTLDKSRRQNKLSTLNSQLTTSSKMRADSGDREIPGVLTGGLRVDVHRSARAPSSSIRAIRVIRGSLL